MRSNYKKLGDFIQQVNNRNNALSVSTLLGVSIQKCFMPSIANTIGTDMSTYKIIKNKQFAYGPVTSRNGDKISIALLEKEEEAILSQAYTVFEVIDHNVLDPEYLMMWFRRPEFDRYARFKSHGSAREVFDWFELCETELPIPSIEKQREIVREYNTIVNRISLNEQLIQKLEETAQTIYKRWFVEGNECENWEKKKIADFGKVITGKTPSSNNPEDFGSEMPFITPGDFKCYKKHAIGSERKLSNIGFSKLSNKILPKGSIIVTCIGSDMGKIALAYERSITNQQMNSIIPDNSFYSDYLYYNLLEYSDELKSLAVGSSTMPMLNKTDFEKIELVNPTEDLLIEFKRILTPSNELVIKCLKEIINLHDLKGLILSKMTKVEETAEKEITT